MMIYAALLALATAATEPVAIEATPDELPIAADESTGGEDGIAQELIDEARKVGELSGVAEACGLEWQEHYAAYMGAKESEGVSELDLVFLGGYHGAAQGNAYSAVSKECTEEQLSDIREALDKNIKKYKK